MIVRFDPDLLAKLKKAKVTVKKSFKTRLAIFSQNPQEPLLNNHPLRKDWAGYRSIDITKDYRAVYTEKIEGRETIAYFVALGTHQELYK